MSINSLFDMLIFSSDPSGERRKIFQILRCADVAILKLSSKGGALNNKRFKPADTFVGLFFFPRLELLQISVVFLREICGFQ